MLYLAIDAHEIIQLRSHSTTVMAEVGRITPGKRASVDRTDQLSDGN